jgi:hypothetical protein
LKFIVVGHRSACSRGQDATHILDYHEAGFQRGDRVGHVYPQPGAGALAHAGAPARRRNVGAREPSADHIDGFHRAPVDLGDVAEVGDVRVAVGEHFGCGGVVFAVPDHFAAEHRFDSLVQHPGSGEEAADPHPATLTRR